MTASDIPHVSAPTPGVGAGPSRRTILAGVAWTVPVLAAASTTPATAATGELTLAFDKSSYSGEACGTISGAYVTATAAGAPAVGTSVTVSLADGYTFSDGSTSHTGAADGNGRVDLPAIKVPAQGGDSTLSASGGGTSTTASVSAARSGKNYNVTANGALREANSKVPSGATPLNAGFFFKDGTLYYIDGTAAATNVVAISTGWRDGQGRNLMAYRTSDGKIYNVTANEAPREINSKVPNGSTPFNAGFFMKGTSLWDASGNLISDQVAAVSDGWNDGNGDGGSNGANVIALRTSDGRVYNVSQGGSLREANSKVPNGSTPLNAGFFLKDKKLYYIDGTEVSKDADGNSLEVEATSTGWNDAQRSNVIALRTSDGRLWNVTANGPLRQAKEGVPAGSEPLNAGYFLKDGVLYYIDGTVVARNVVGTSTGWNDNQSNVMALSKADCA